jgi:CRP/FNR family transcriptional regulator
MTRAEIGNYLGIAKETVSRLFTRFEQQGLIQVMRRQLRLCDLHGLAALADMPQLGELSSRLP